MFRAMKSRMRESQKKMRPGKKRWVWEIRQVCNLWTEMNVTLQCNISSRLMGASHFLYFLANKMVMAGQSGSHMVKGSFYP